VWNAMTRTPAMAHLPLHNVTGSAVAPGDPCLAGYRLSRVALRATYLTLRRSLRPGQA
jgi:hypothetical protein